MNTTELPEYHEAVRALAPVLYDLPSRLVAISGRPGSGKTTLGRYLAWRFNVSLLETDLFVASAPQALSYRIDEIDRIIDLRLNIPRPIIIDGAFVLKILADLNRKADFLIHISNKKAPDNFGLKSEVEKYEEKFRPLACADLTIALDID